MIKNSAPAAIINIDPFTVSFANHKTYREKRRSATVSVFCINIAMVIGPTPPGTGVIAKA